MQWQPIDTAPRDGSPILAHNPAWDHASPVTCRWMGVQVGAKAVKGWACYSPVYNFATWCFPVAPPTAWLSGFVMPEGAAT